MNNQLVPFALLHRENNREPNYFTSADLSGIIARLGGTPRVPLVTTTRMRSGRRRGSGGVMQQGGVQQLGGAPKQYSNRVMQQFKVDTDINGNPIVLRQAKRPTDVGGARYFPVVALEDLEAVIDKHQELALGYGGIRAVFNHVRWRPGVGRLREWEGGLQHFWRPAPSSRSPPPASRPRPSCHLPSTAALQRHHAPVTGPRRGATHRSWPGGL